MFLDDRVTIAIAAHPIDLSGFAVSGVALCGMLLVVAGIACICVVTTKDFNALAVTTAIACISAVASYLVTDYILQPFFGRPGVYEFLTNPKNTFGSAFGSLNTCFPSGHTAIAAAFSTVLWVNIPKWRFVYLGGMCAIMAALVLGQWHFISDTIAGAVVGTTTAAYIMNRVSSQMPAPADDIA
jgi:membrane-associated phospholipid phosphatase